MELFRFICIYHTFLNVFINYFIFIINFNNFRQYTMNRRTKLPYFFWVFYFPNFWCLKAYFYFISPIIMYNFLKNNIFIRFQLIFSLIFIEFTKLKFQECIGLFYWSKVGTI